MSRARVREAVRQAHGEGTFTCPGPHPEHEDNVAHGFTSKIQHGFRCYYCGLWFCRQCAGEHFGGER